MWLGFGIVLILAILIPIPILVIQYEKKSKHLDIKQIYSVFLQSILLQMNSMEKNQQPKELTNKLD